MIRRFVLVCSALLLVAACTHATPIGATPRTPVPSPSTTDDVGRLFVAALGETRYVSAEGYLAPDFRTAMPDTAIRAKWDALAGKYGKFKSVGDVTSAAAGADTIVSVVAQFAGGAATLHLTVNPALQVTAIDWGN